MIMPPGFVAIPIPEPYRTVLDRTTERDRQFFTDHPGARSYSRPYIEGECWPHMHPGPGTILVTLTQCGRRVRVLTFDNPSA